MKLVQKWCTFHVSKGLAPCVFLDTLRGRFLTDNNAMAGESCTDSAKRMLNGHHVTNPQASLHDTLG